VNVHWCVSLLPSPAQNSVKIRPLTISNAETGGLDQPTEWARASARTCLRMFQGAWLKVSEAYAGSEEDLGPVQPAARGAAREHSAELERVHLDAGPA
jgi:hypothetical protein